MERKIGEIFEYNGEWYQCIRSILTCSICEIPRPCSKIRELGYCSSNMRNDKEQVVFKKLEKVGEPYVGNNGTFQSYKLAMPIYGDIPDQIIGFTTTEVVIKQNEEDMSNTETLWYGPDKKEAKNLKLSNFRPFNLELAKQGKPVCTRDGRKARIICFDRIDSTGCNLTIVALIQVDETEVLQLYHDNGKCNAKADLDLMMLPEKKEGWVNVYPDDRMGEKRYSTKEEASCYSRSNVIDTIKIEWEE